MKWEKQLILDKGQENDLQMKEDTARYLFSEKLMFKYQKLKNF